jgi:hypothetical protein
MSAAPRRNRRRQFKIDPSLGPEQFQRQIGKIARTLALQRVAQDAPHFFLHRTAMFGSANSEPGLQAVFKISDGEAGHQRVLCDQ